MKILELCLSESLGGLELYFNKCTVWLEKSKHDLIVATREQSRLSALVTAQKMEQFHLPKAGKLLPLKAAKILCAKIEGLHIDIVHVHHKDDLPLTALAKSLCKRKFKLVHTRQMQIPHSKKDIYHRYIYGKIDLLITISDTLKQEALLRLPMQHAKIKRLYYGVKPPDNLSRQNCSDDLSLKGENSLLIGVFSRIEALKGQHLILDAVQPLIGKGLTLKVHFYGDIMDQNYYQGLIQSIEKHGLTEYIVFKGFVKNPQQVMPCYDIIILPSKSETFGLVLIEAMRAGVAVIGTNAGGVPEIIDDRDTGLLFDWEDSTTLSGHIEELYHHPMLRKKLAQNGQKKADTLFDEETHFQTLEKMMRES